MPHLAKDGFHHRQNASFSVLLSEAKVLVRSMNTRRSIRSWTRMSETPNFSNVSAGCGENDSGRPPDWVAMLILSIYISSASFAPQVVDCLHKSRLGIV